MPNIRYRFWNMTAPAAATHMEGTVSTKNENTSVDWFQNPSVHTSWTALANAKLPILCGCLNIWEIIVLFATAGSTEGQKENKKTQLCTVNVMTPCTVHGTSCICRWPSGMCRWWSHWTWDQKVEGSTLGSGSDLPSSPLHLIVVITRPMKKMKVTEQNEPDFEMKRACCQDQRNPRDWQWTLP